VDDIAKIFGERGDLAHLALFLWASGASALLVWTLKELAAFTPRNAAIRHPRMECRIQSVTLPAIRQTPIADVTRAPRRGFEPAVYRRPEGLGP
jgi:hypothetical protein